ncbi:hypothetical protein [Algoriphagus boritolerans]|uniref:hypothetical protein n=1 Tax=Algoriphagus boritolerans TaxID=308111 RepID=UPI000B214041
MEGYERVRPNRVRVERMSTPYLESQIRALVGFEIRITEAHASAKLSQNRDDENYRAIIQKLEESSRPIEQALAEEMKKRRKTE